MSERLIAREVSDCAEINRTSWFEVNGLAELSVDGPIQLASRCCGGIAGHTNDCEIVAGAVVQWQRNQLPIRRDSTSQFVGRGSHLPFFE